MPPLTQNNGPAQSSGGRTQPASADDETTTAARTISPIPFVTQLSPPAPEGEASPPAPPSPRGRGASPLAPGGPARDPPRREDILAGAREGEVAGGGGGRVARHPDGGVQGRPRQRAGVAGGCQAGVGDGVDRTRAGAAGAGEGTGSHSAHIHEVNAVGT